MFFNRVFCPENFLDWGNILTLLFPIWCLLAIGGLLSTWKITSAIELLLHSLLNNLKANINRFMCLVAIMSDSPGLKYSTWSPEDNRCSFFLFVPQAKKKKSPQWPWLKVCYHSLVNLFPYLKAAYDQMAEQFRNNESKFVS